jgi:hypothetical protein
VFVKIKGKVLLKKCRGIQPYSTKGAGIIGVVLFSMKMFDISFLKGCRTMRMVVVMEYV